jgi:hypothetical protein
MQRTRMHALRCDVHTQGVHQGTASAMGPWLHMQQPAAAQHHCSSWQRAQLDQGCCCSTSCSSAAAGCCCLRRIMLHQRGAQHAECWLLQQPGCAAAHPWWWRPLPMRLVWCWRWARHLLTCRPIRCSLLLRRPIPCLRRLCPQVCSSSTQVPSVRRQAWRSNTCTDTSGLRLHSTFAKRHLLGDVRMRSAVGAVHGSDASSAMLATLERAWGV